MKVTEAVKALRVGLGDTQQAFAARLKLAISTVVRYESVRPPRGRALAEFHRLASANGLQDIAAVFRQALMKELADPNAETLEPITLYVTLQKARAAILRKQTEIAIVHIDDALKKLAASDTMAVIEALTVEHRERSK